MAEAKTNVQAPLSDAERYAAEKCNAYVGDRWHTINLSEVYSLYARSLKQFSAVTQSQSRGAA